MPIPNDCKVARLAIWGGVVQIEKNDSFGGMQKKKFTNRVCPPKKILLKGPPEKKMFGQFNPKKIFFYDFLGKPCYKQNSSINFAKKRIKKKPFGGYPKKKITFVGSTKKKIRSWKFASRPPR